MNVMYFNKIGIIEETLLTRNVCMIFVLRRDQVYNITSLSIKLQFREESPSEDSKAQVSPQLTSGSLGRP